MRYELRVFLELTDNLVTLESALALAAGAKGVIRGGLKVGVIKGIETKLFEEGRTAKTVTRGEFFEVASKYVPKSRRPAVIEHLDAVYKGQKEIPLVDAVNIIQEYRGGGGL